MRGGCGVRLTGKVQGGLVSIAQRKVRGKCKANTV